MEYTSLLLKPRYALTDTYQNVHMKLNAAGSLLYHHDTQESLNFTFEIIHRMGHDNNIEQRSPFVTASSTIHQSVQSALSTRRHSDL